MGKMNDQDPTSCETCPYLNNIEFLQRTQPEYVFIQLRLFIRGAGNYCSVYLHTIKDILKKNCNN